MAEKAPGWVIPAMRAGHGARGLVYTVVGLLALAAAIRGGSAEGTQSALGTLAGEAWGIALLWIIALGLFAYAVWRWIDSAMDLEDYGHDARGIMARIGLLVTGAVHAALGVSAARIALGAGSGGGSGAETLTARVMQMPAGAWLVGVIGLATIGAGLYYTHKGLTGKYREDIRRSGTTQKLDPVMKAGFVAQGGVVATIGVFILYAALTADPSQSGGLGAIFDEVRSAAFGRVFLGILALGLIAFAIENFIEAVYRIVPRHAGSDVGSLASRMRDGAERKARDGVRALRA